MGVFNYKKITMFVTKATAEKLAAAGYPQDGEGGAWYNDLCGEIISTALKYGQQPDWSQLPGAVYAPDVVELLEAMSGKCLLSHTNGRWEAHVAYPQRMNFYHDNPAEALAEAYLFINKPLEAA